MSTTSRQIIVLRVFSLQKHLFCKNRQKRTRQHTLQCVVGYLCFIIGMPSFTVVFIFIQTQKDGQARPFVRLVYKYKGDNPLYIKICVLLLFKHFSCNTCVWVNTVWCVCQNPTAVTYAVTVCIAVCYRCVLCAANMAVIPVCCCIILWVVAPNVFACCWCCFACCSCYNCTCCRVKYFARCNIFFCR